MTGHGTQTFGARKRKLRSIIIKIPVTIDTLTAAMLLVQEACRARTCGEAADANHEGRREMKKRRIRKHREETCTVAPANRSMLLAVVAVGLATVGFIKPFAPTHGTSPTFEILVVTPNKLVRVYGNNFTDLLNGDPVPTTLHIENVKTYTVHAIDGSIIGTDVDVSMIPPGTYDCWISDPFLGDSNHIELTITRNTSPGIPKHICSRNTRRSHRHGSRGSTRQTSASAMKKAAIPYFLAAAFLVLNLADVVSTWISVSSGKGVEGNFLVLMLGGPFSVPALFLKLFVVPGRHPGVAWWVSRRLKDTRLGMAAILPAGRSVRSRRGQQRHSCRQESEEALPVVTAGSKPGTWLPDQPSFR